jgi:hypothetical protein
MTNVATKERRAVRAGWAPDLGVVALTAVVAVAAWVLLTQLGGVRLEAPMGGQVRDVGLAAVVVSALVAAGAGTGLLRVLEARTAAGLGIWTVVAVLVCLLSLVGPGSAPTTAAVAGLASLHLVVALVLVVGLRAVRRR